jgi:hypothetical protein
LNLDTNFAKKLDRFIKQRIFFLGIKQSKLTSDSFENLGIESIECSPSRLGLGDRIVLDPLTASVLEEILARIRGQIHSFDDPGS